MKKITLLLFSVSVSLMSFGQKKGDIIREINSYKKELVSNASYDNEYSEVWNAALIIANEEYPTISRESESKGYIEANIEKELYKKYITIEILGDKAPYRVSFRLKTEKRSKDENGVYTAWQIQSGSNGAYYVKLRIRLYELLIGPIELPEELIKKIDDYNALQTKERKKIVKGENY